MLKIFASISLFLFCHKFILSVIFIGFYAVDKEGFIQKYCSNKDKPEMHCDGKCKLMDTIEYNSEDENTPLNVIVPEFNESILFMNLSNFVCCGFKKTNKSLNFSKVYSIKNIYLEVTYPPPEVV
jgi:hypothetical protein